MPIKCVITKSFKLPMIFCLIFFYFITDLNEIFNHQTSETQNQKNFFQCKLEDLPSFNTLTSGLIQAVRKKQLDRTWLCVRISPLLYGLRTWSKCQKTRQVL